MIKYMKVFEILNLELYLFTVVQCEMPPQIINGHVSVINNASVFGAVAEYSCLKGYKLHGARLLICLATGLWDKAIPHCHRKYWYHNCDYPTVKISRFKFEYL